MLNEVDLIPRPDLWVLEMAIMDPVPADFGAFYEDLLLAGSDALAEIPCVPAGIRSTSR